MFTPADLLDLHRRTHASVQRLIDHCAGLRPEDLRRELPGFGYPTVLRQLHHMAATERYWIGVLEGRMLAEEHETDWASIEAVGVFRASVLASTRAYLGRTSEADLRQRRPMTVWGGKEVPLVPLLVFLRTQTHAFQHMGQVTAMCRLLGRPVPPGLDFPLGE
jgi:uncharacterized damage-inducible protein DinB